MLTEAHGIPLAVVVDGANRHDMKLVKRTLEDLKVERPSLVAWWPQGLCLDKGYDYDEIRDLVTAFGWTAHIRARGEEAEQLRHKASFQARRWVVERTHSWINRFRGLLVRWAKKAQNYLAFLHLACGIITWRTIGLLR